MTQDDLDPKGLIREAYKIDGITPGECRSIFLDWALSVSDVDDHRSKIEALEDRYGTAHPDHPMTDVIREGLRTAQKPKRRGGWRSRDR